MNNIQGGAFKSGKYYFDKCHKYENRESHFYQDGALNMDADTKNTEVKWALRNGSAHAPAS
jgi:hypothetical protein